MAAAQRGLPPGISPITIELSLRRRQKDAPAEASITSIQIKHDSTVSLTLPLPEPRRYRSEAFLVMKKKTTAKKKNPSSPVGSRRGRYVSTVELVPSVNKGEPRTAAGRTETNGDNRLTQGAGDNEAEGAADECLPLVQSEATVCQGHEKRDDTQESSSLLSDPARAEGSSEESNAVENRPALDRRRNSKGSLLRRQERVFRERDTIQPTESIPTESVYGKYTQHSNNRNSFSFDNDDTGGTTALKETYRHFDEDLVVVHNSDTDSETEEAKPPLDDSTESLEGEINPLWVLDSITASVGGSSSNTNERLNDNHFLMEETRELMKAPATKTTQVPIQKVKPVTRAENSARSKFDIRSKPKVIHNVKRQRDNGLKPQMDNLSKSKVENSAKPKMRTSTTNADTSMNTSSTSEGELNKRLSHCSDWQESLGFEPHKDEDFSGYIEGEDYFKNLPTFHQLLTRAESNEKCNGKDKDCDLRNYLSLPLDVQMPELHERSDYVRDMEDAQALQSEYWDYPFPLQSDTTNPIATSEDHREVLENMRTRIRGRFRRQANSSSDSGCQDTDAQSSSFEDSDLRLGETQLSGDESKLDKKYDADDEFNESLASLPKLDYSATRREILNGLQKLVENAKCGEAPSKLDLSSEDFQETSDLETSYRMSFDSSQGMNLDSSQRMSLDSPQRMSSNSLDGDVGLPAINTIIEIRTRENKTEVISEQHLAKTDGESNEEQVDINLNDPDIVEATRRMQVAFLRRRRHIRPNKFKSKSTKGPPSNEVYDTSASDKDNLISGLTDTNISPKQPGDNHGDDKVNDCSTDRSKMSDQIYAESDTLMSEVCKALDQSEENSAPEKPIRRDNTPDDTLVSGSTFQPNKSIQVSCAALKGMNEHEHAMLIEDRITCECHLVKENKDIEYTSPIIKETTNCSANLSTESPVPTHRRTTICQGFYCREDAKVKDDAIHSEAHNETTVSEDLDRSGACDQIDLSDPDVRAASKVLQQAFRRKNVLNKHRKGTAEETACEKAQNYTNASGVTFNRARINCPCLEDSTSGDCSQLVSSSVLYLESDTLVNVLIDEDQAKHDDVTQEAMNCHQNKTKGEEISESNIAHYIPTPESSAEQYKGIVVINDKTKDDHTLAKNEAENVTKDSPIFTPSLLLDDVITTKQPSGIGALKMGDYVDIDLLDAEVQEVTRKLQQLCPSPPSPSHSNKDTPILCSTSNTPFTAGPLSLPVTSANSEVDIDLKDPGVQDAAKKIQGVFRRKKSPKVPPVSTGEGQASSHPSSVAVQEEQSNVTEQGLVQAPLRPGSKRKGVPELGNAGSLPTTSGASFDAWIPPPQDHDGKETVVEMDADEVKQVGEASSLINDLDNQAVIGDGGRADVDPTSCVQAHVPAASKSYLDTFQNANLGLLDIASDETEYETARSDFSEKHDDDFDPPLDRHADAMTYAKMMESRPGSHAPRFLIRPKDIRHRSGGSVRFVCCITGDPRPEVNWFVSGEAIQRDNEKSRLRITDYRGEEADDVSLVANEAIGACVVVSILEVTELRSTESGEYACVASNREGHASCSASLYFEEDDAKDLLPQHRGICRSQEGALPNASKPTSNPGWSLRDQDLPSSDLTPQQRVASVTNSGTTFYCIGQDAGGHSSGGEIRIQHPPKLVICQPEHFQQTTPVESSVEESIVVSLLTPRRPTHRQETEALLDDVNAASCRKTNLENLACFLSNMDREDVADLSDKDSFAIYPSGDNAIDGLNSSDDFLSATGPRVGMEIEVDVHSTTAVLQEATSAEARPDKIVKRRVNRRNAKHRYSLPDSISASAGIIRDKGAAIQRKSLVRTKSSSRKKRTSSWKRKSTEADRVQVDLEKAEELTMKVDSCLDIINDLLSLTSYDENENQTEANLRRKLDHLVQRFADSESEANNSMTGSTHSDGRNGKRKRIDLHHMSDSNGERLDEADVRLNVSRIQGETRPWGPSTLEDSLKVMAELVGNIKGSVREVDPGTTGVDEDGNSPNKSNSNNNNNNNNFSDKWQKSILGMPPPRPQTIKRTPLRELLKQSLFANDFTSRRTRRICLPVSRSLDSDDMPNKNARSSSTSGIEERRRHSVGSPYSRPATHGPLKRYRSNNRRKRSFAPSTSDSSSCDESLVTESRGTSNGRRSARVRTVHRPPSRPCGGMVSMSPSLDLDPEVALSAGLEDKCQQFPDGYDDSLSPLDCGGMDCSSDDSDAIRRDVYSRK